MLKAFSLQGRLDRLSYFLLNVAVIAIAAAVAFVLTRLPTLVGTQQAISVAQGLVALTYLLAITASPCLMVRRLHDFDQSGWWAPSVFVLHLVYGNYGAANSLTGTILLGTFLLRFIF